ncbi:MAG TPA: hypothetical protein VGD08_23160 [Stellaceae bacterium]|jgi:hypothetical protein
MDFRRRVAGRVSPALLLLTLAALSACSSNRGPPHSDYAVIQFEKGSATLTAEGRAAIAHAAHEAKAQHPTAIRLRGDMNGDGASIARARVEAVQAALRAAGVPDAVIETSEAADRRGVATEDVVVQLVFDPRAGTAETAARHDGAVADSAKPAPAADNAEQPAPSQD